jgi:pyruvate,water dikinase
VGVVYEGKLEYTEEEIDLGALPKLRTKIAVNLANPSQAFETSFYPVHGVGTLVFHLYVLKCMRACSNGVYTSEPHQSSPYGIHSS